MAARSSNRKCRDAPVVLACTAMCFLAILIAMTKSNAHTDMNAEVERIIVPEINAPVPANGAGGAAIAVRIAGRTLFFNAGSADQVAQRPITTDSLFNIASVRKLFEATLVADGMLRGELRFDDPVAKYVGELHGDYIRRVTIGQLAVHTSGLLLPTDHPPWPNESYSLAEFLDTLNAWTPPAGVEPGKQRIYTHAGYVLLQVALERRYHSTIRDLIESRILQPLGMDSTLVPERGPDDHAITSPQFARRLVQGYSADGKPIGAPGNQQSYYDFPGTGQMFSSARDLAKFLAASLGECAIDVQLQEALQATQREAFRVDAQNAQAMAWEINAGGGPIIVDKPGGINNASAYLGLVPKQKLGIVILSNRGDVYPFEAARNTILPELARLSSELR